MLFRMLGSLRATANGDDADLGGHKQRVVLAGLLLHSNRVVSRVMRCLETSSNRLPCRRLNLSKRPASSPSNCARCSFSTIAA